MTQNVIDIVSDRNRVTEALNGLKGKGYELEFRREATCIYCFEWQQWIMPENFTVDESYYFEEIENPDADRMLYAISLSQNVKGFLIDTCNVYSDNISHEMMQKLQLNEITRGNDLTSAAAMTKVVKVFKQAMY
jgi:hypothetical protein